MLDSQRISRDITVHEIARPQDIVHRSDDPDFETKITEERAWSAKRLSLNTQLLEAMDKETEQATLAIAAKVEMPSERWTPELKELREVAGKISIMDYFRAAEEGRPANGAAG